MIHKTLYINYQFIKKKTSTRFTLEYDLLLMYTCKCEIKNTWWTRIYLYSNKIMTNVHAGNKYGIF